MIFDYWKTIGDGVFESKDGERHRTSGISRRQGEFSRNL
jgi:hypothetical protein